MQYYGFDKPVITYSLDGEDYIQLVQQELTFDRSISELGVAINITDDSQFELREEFFVRLSTVDPNVILGPAQTVIRILSDDGNVFVQVSVVIDIINIMSIMHVVVTFGFHQRQYTFLEGVGDAMVCVDRNGSTAIPVNVTVIGSEFGCFVEITIITESTGACRK